jgi:hypothetical protein
MSIAPAQYTGDSGLTLGIRALDAWTAMMTPTETMIPILGKNYGRSCGKSLAANVWRRDMETEQGCRKPTKGNDPKDSTLPCGTRLYWGERGNQVPGVLLCAKCKAETIAHLMFRKEGQ